MLKQPKSTTSLDTKTFEILKRKMKTTKMCYERRLEDPIWSLDVPYEIGFKLTNRCDLRCTHCFQWNETGYHKHYDKNKLNKQGDLDFNIIKRTLEELEENLNIIYFWGGEPLVYSHFDDLAMFLEKSNTKKIMCTNGISVHSKVDALCKMSENFNLMFSIEGFEKEHNLLRGKNTFEKAMNNIHLLFDQKNKGNFKGTIDVACVVSNTLVPRMVEFCEFMEETCIDTLYINFPWYIPNNIAQEVDHYFEQHFSWMETGQGKFNSWHSFDYHIDETQIETIIHQIREIKNRAWNIRIRFRPQLKEHEISDFIRGIPTPYEDKQICLGLSNRLDVQPDGSVTPCKKFPEFIVGNLHKNSLLEIWKGDAYNRFRKIYNNHLNPLCLKCEILEMTGV